MHIEKIKNKIVSREGAARKIKEWQDRGDKIVFTNGCFDIVHRGHVEYLSRAADFGQHLVIGLNTDDSVSRLKGPDRPIVDEESRAILLAALQFVDMVIYFDEDTPYELIKTIQPDILVKGSDYNVEDIVGYDIVTGLGGKVETIDFVEGFSTSNIIEKIKKSD
ncbi:MAG: D-glycero-beta-D-manno-heptose 1-phosphate adenylyltransferase [Chlorobi bacterium]|nr:D-glycero-beta-D-manno-heptose 1-phosphate adenylyltransferase [Chlorobiota bacterium]